MTRADRGARQISQCGLPGRTAPRRAMSGPSSAGDRLGARSTGRRSRRRCRATQYQAQNASGRPARPARSGSRSAKPADHVIRASAGGEPHPPPPPPASHPGRSPAPLARPSRSTEC
jgi:hypothetical protein